MCLLTKLPRVLLGCHIVNLKCHVIHLKPLALSPPGFWSGLFSIFKFGYVRFWKYVCKSKIIKNEWKQHYDNTSIHIYRKFHLQKLKIFIFLLKNIDCGYSLEPPRPKKHRLWYSFEPPRRGGSNEYPQSMVLSRNKKNDVYPCKPQFYYIKVGFKGVNII